MSQFFHRDSPGFDQEPGDNDLFGEALAAGDFNGDNIQDLAMVHATADTEIRLSQAREIRDNAGSDDVTYHELKGAPHYLEGHRPEAMEIVAEWLRARFPN